MSAGFIRRFYDRKSAHTGLNSTFFPYNFRMTRETLYEEEGKALAALRASKGFRQGEFAEMLGVSEDVMSHLERGVTRLRGSRRQRAALLLGLDDEELRRRLLKPGDHSVRGSNLSPTDEEVTIALRRIPVYGPIAAGKNSYAPTDVIEHILLAVKPGVEAWGRFVVGDSMEPEFEEGDIAVFQEMPYDNGHGVHAFGQGEEQFKIYRKISGASAELWPTNPDREPFSAKDFQVRGVCVKRVRYGAGRVSATSASIRRVTCTGFSRGP